MYGSDMHNFPLPVFEEKTCDDSTLPERRFGVGFFLSLGSVRVRDRGKVRVEG
jgi:hypothetical protein